MFSGDVARDVAHFRLFTYVHIASVCNGYVCDSRLLTLYNLMLNKYLNCIILIGCESCTYYLPSLYSWSLIKFVWLSDFKPDFHKIKDSESLIGNFATNRCVRSLEVLRMNGLCTSKEKSAFLRFISSPEPKAHGELL